MRLINAEKLEYSFELSIESWSWDRNSNAPAIANTYKMALKQVKEEPTIDAVEVVRCKNCKWWKDKSRCCNVNGLNNIVYNGDWFCRSGERREEDA